MVEFLQKFNIRMKNNDNKIKDNIKGMAKMTFI